MSTLAALATDAYKLDHRRQYPANTELVFSNFTPRSTRRPNNTHVVWFGLQYVVKRFLIDEWNREFFDKPFYMVKHTFERRINTFLGPNAIGSDHLKELHELGYLPITIFALPEGSRVPYKVAPMVMWNSDARFAWLVNYLETALSAELWGMSTSATTAYQYLKLLTKYAKQTAGSTDFVQWQGHDFSFRGMFGIDAATKSGAAHLTCFTGTDTIPAIDLLEQYYGADAEKELIGGSVAATEHSVMCAGGIDDELGTFRRLIAELYPNGIVSIVSDTWDFWNVLTNTAVTLKPEIMARDGKVVFRPDSGDPVKIVCGDPNADPSTPAFKGAIEVLWDQFGGTISPTGYKMLDSHVGLIYGDSITIERAEAICAGLEAKGFASTNLVYGIGSFTYQHVTRDTDGWAMKATYVIVDGEPREIFKDPKTDDGGKKSAKGLIAVTRDPGEDYAQEDQCSWENVFMSDYECIVYQGHVEKIVTLADIRATIQEELARDLA